MSLIVQASRSIFAHDGPALLKAVTTSQKSITPDVGTWQAVVVCRVCALCCLCAAVIWLFENLQFGRSAYVGHILSHCYYIFTGRL